MDLFTIDLNIISHDDDNLDDDDRETIILVRPIVGVIDINNDRHVKKI